jgi:hypothetical protein
VNIINKSINKKKITVILIILMVFITNIFFMDSVVNAAEEMFGKVDLVMIADSNNSKMEEINELEEKKEKKRQRKWEKIREMSLETLDEEGHIDRLCKKYDMSKRWFDIISTTESGYGVKTPNGSYNAWGWGIYGNKVTKLGDNWYDSSKRFIKEFAENYGHSPSKSSMRRYCPSGAYDKYF